MAHLAYILTIFDQDVQDRNHRVVLYSNHFLPTKTHLNQCNWKFPHARAVCNRFNAGWNHGACQWIRHIRILPVEPFFIFSSQNPKSEDLIRMKNSFVYVGHRYVQWIRWQLSQLEYQFHNIFKYRILNAIVQ